MLKQHSTLVDHDPDWEDLDFVPEFDDDDEDDYDDEDWYWDDDEDEDDDLDF